MTRVKVTVTDEKAKCDSFLTLKLAQVYVEGGHAVSYAMRVCCSPYCECAVRV